MNRWLKVGVCFILASVCVAAAVKDMPWPSTPDFADVKAIKVSRVIDGDTIEVPSLSGKDVVRLVGVDAPETGAAYGAESTAFLRNLLAGESVYLVRKEDEERDRYGRRLCYLYRVPDGLYVNLELVRQGYAAVTKGSPFAQRETFEFYERRAKAYQKGMWQERMAEILKARPAPEPAAAPIPARRAVTAVPIVVPPPQIKPRQVTEGVTVYITRTGKKYHRGGCRYLSKSKIPISLSDAKRRGYTPCKVCGPP